MQHAHRTFGRLLTATTLAATLVAGTLVPGHARAQGRTVTLTYTEHWVDHQILVNGQPKCLSMKHTSFYNAGKLQTGALCVGAEWVGAGHTLVNGMEAVDHYSGYDYPEAANGCTGGTLSGHLAFANGSDGWDYADTYEDCPVDGRPDHQTGEIWGVLTMGYGHYLGASGHVFETFTFSVLAQKPPKPGESAPPLTAIGTSKTTVTLTLAR